MSRWQAAGIHLVLSAAIGVAALFVLLRVWYPPPLFSAEGGDDLLFILIAVDVVIGPLITLIIFKADKPSLRFDLSVIALIQACALVYGVHVMFVARPVYIALVIDQFETVRANDIETADLAQARPEFRSNPLAGPIFVGIDMPKDKAEIAYLVAEARKGGKVVTALPKYYRPYADHKAKALAQSQPIEPILKQDNDFAKQMQRFIDVSGRKAQDLNYLPLQTRRGWGAVLIDAKSGDVVTMVSPKL